MLSTLFFLNFWRCTSISKDLMINEQIRDKEVRLIDSDGSQLGIMSSKDAQKIADDKNLDLVKISPNAKPPVCKVLDYGKYKFELSKKEKEARKNQHVVNIKEVRFSPTIDEHDLQTKASNAVKFLKAGDKVKITIRFRGREVQHASQSVGLLERFASLCEEVGVVEKPAKLEGRNMAMFLAPKPPEKGKKEKA